MPVMGGVVGGDSRTATAREETSGSENVKFLTALSSVSVHKAC
jgi:hypothetical protein